MVLVDERIRRTGLLQDPLARALLLSLAFHLALFSTLELGHRVEWLKRNRLLTLLREALFKPVVHPSATTRKPPLAAHEVSLLFVDVDPDQATPEPPAESKFYSTLNSKAANPNPSVDSYIPRIDGEQTKIVKTFDTLRPQPTPPEETQPITPPVKKPEPAVPAAQPKPKPQTGLEPGDLTMAKPEPKRQPEEGKTETDSEDALEEVRPRPRTLAAARLQKGILAGQKMKQEGGVKRRSVESSLDVRATLFGAYDAAIIAAVQDRWYYLLDEIKYAHSQEGKVVLRFHLNHDGRITDLQLVKTEVDELLAALCQRAIRDPSPYGEWPSDLRRMVGNTFREVQFTFHY